MELSAKAAFHKGCEDWVAREGNVMCTQANGRNKLKDLYLRLKSDSSKKQVKNAVIAKLSRIRPIIDPKYTNKNVNKAMRKSWPS